MADTKATRTGTDVSRSRSPEISSEEEDQLRQIKEQIEHLSGTLRRLAALTPKNRPAAENLDSTIREYARRIIDDGYRADAAFAVIAHWADDHAEWPAWHELKLALDDARLPQRTPLPPPEHRPLAPGPMSRSHARNQREAYAATVMRTDLGQTAIAEAWARFLWDFVVEHGRTPSEAEQGRLRHGRDEFMDGMMQCYDPEAWPKATPKIQAWRPLGVAREALIKLGDAMLAREQTIAEEYRA